MYVLVGGVPLFFVFRVPWMRWATRDVDFERISQSTINTAETTA